MIGARFLAVLGVLALAVLPAAADSWPAPQTKEVFSESREYFVRIVSGNSVADVVGFSGARKGKYATAEFYRREKNRSYQFVTEVTLLNPVAPVEFFVSNSGFLATIDNWHNVGYGSVVAIYDRHGKLARA